MDSETMQSVLTTLIPAIWGAVGPIVMATLTKFINESVRAHVPRTLQVILSSVLGGIAASLGDAGTVATAATSLAGAVSQAYAGAQPNSLRTGPSPEEPSLLVK